jgi:transposase, IS30 family
MACQLTFLEREPISQMHEAGASSAEIAAELRRARSTVGREIKRNSSAGRYSAVVAQSLSQQRRRQTDRE